MYFDVLFLMVTAYEALCGNPSFLSHSAIAYLYVNMWKITGAHASTSGFPHYSSYGAILWLQDNYTLLCGKIKTYIRYNIRISRVLTKFVQYLIYLSCKVYFEAIYRITINDVILFIHFWYNDTQKNGCNPRFFIDA